MAKCSCVQVLPGMIAPLVTSPPLPFEARRSVMVVWWQRSSYDQVSTNMSDLPSISNTERYFAHIPLFLDRACICEYVFSMCIIGGNLGTEF